MEIPDLKQEIKSIKDFHNLVLPILKPELDELQAFNTPPFHWNLYNDFDSIERKFLAVAPVGFAKSTILKIWGLKEFLDQKDPYILYVSSSATKSNTQIATIMKVLQTPFIQVIYKYKVLKNNESEIVIQFDDNGKKQKFEAIASGADISGINFESQRPTLILIDDLEELEQAKSRERTDKLQEWLNTTLISRLPSLNTGRIRMINTVLSVDSLTNRILGRAPNINKDLFKDWRYSFYQALKDDLSIWEDQHPTSFLIEEQRLRPHTFASNYMNEPLDLSNSLIKLEDLRYYDYLNLDDIGKLYMHADTTHTGKTTSDYFCLTVLGENTKNKNFYITDFILEKLDVEQQARKAIVMYLKYRTKVRKFTYDEKSNQGFGFWIKKLAREEYNVSLPIEELKYPSDKVTHFEPHVPHFKANRVYLPSKHNMIDQATTQIIAFPSKDINDDFVDGLSGVLDNFTQLSTTVNLSFL